MKAFRRVYVQWLPVWQLRWWRGTYWPLEFRVGCVRVLVRRKKLALAEAKSGRYR